MKMLFALFAGLLGQSAKRVLMGAGVGITSAAFFNTIIMAYINRSISTLNQTDSNYLGLLALFGVDHAISVCIGALICRATIMAMSISISKV